MSIQRTALEAAFEASCLATRNAARRVQELDRALANTLSNQLVLQAKRDSLDSGARRKLRADIWRALARDCSELEHHAGDGRLEIAVVVSVTADKRRKWAADVWLPVGTHDPSGAAPSALWNAAVEACNTACGLLVPGGPGPELVRANGLVGLRVNPGQSQSRDALKAAIVQAMDRTRVRATQLHQLQVEVSVVWLDLAVSLDDPPERLSPSILDEESDTLVGGVVRP
jgi:hypothetical protein